jgi:hypothetical protein
MTFCGIGVVRVIHLTLLAVYGILLGFLKIWWIAIFIPCPATVQLGQSQEMSISVESLMLNPIYKHKTS